MPFFICPNCGHREVSGARTAGFSSRPKGCSKCGFGFVFELLDDYYPAPNAAFFVCDQQARVIDAGHGSFELTGLTDEDVIGRPVREVLGLEWIDPGDGGRERRHQRRRQHRPDRDLAGVGRALARQARLGQRRGRSSRPRRSPTSSPPMTTTAGCCSSSPRRARAAWVPRRRNLFVLLFVLGLVAVSAIVIATKETKLGLDLQGGLAAGLPGPADRHSRPKSPAKTSKTRSTSSKSGSTSSASPRPKSRGSAPTRSRSACPGVTDANRATEQVGTTAQLFFYDWEPNLIGPEAAIGGHPGAAPPPEALKAPRSEWQEAGRPIQERAQRTADRRRRLPERLPGGSAGLRTEAETEDCDNCSVAKPRYYLFEKDKPHKLIAGPELSEKDLYVSPTGEKRCRKTGSCSKSRRAPSSSPNSPTDADGKLDEAAEPGWFALKDDPALSGSEITEPEAGNRPGSANRTSPSTSPTRARTPSRTSPARSPSAARPRRSARRAREEAAALSGHFAVVLDNEVKIAADHQLRREPGRDRRPQRRPDLRRLQQHRRGPGTRRRSCRSARCRST